MKVAIPSNDQKSITVRTGKTTGFMVYELSDNKIKNSSYIINPIEHKDHDEESEHSHADIVSLIADCEYIIVKNAGKHFKHDLENASIKIFKTHEDLTANAISNFLNHS